MGWHKGERPQSRRWRKVRLQALTRDGYRCVKCGKAGRLEVDHIIPLEQGSPMYALDALQTLCRECHFRKTATENRPPNPERTEWQAYLSSMV